MPANMLYGSTQMFEMHTEMFPIPSQLRHLLQTSFKSIQNDQHTTNMF